MLSLFTLTALCLAWTVTSVVYDKSLLSFGSAPFSISHRHMWVHASTTNKMYIPPLCCTLPPLLGIFSCCWHTFQETLQGHSLCTSLHLEAARMGSMSPHFLDGWLLLCPCSSLCYRPWCEAQICRTLLWSVSCNWLIWNCTFPLPLPLFESTSSFQVELVPMNTAELFRPESCQLITNKWDAYLCYFWHTPGWHTASSWTV